MSSVAETRHRIYLPWSHPGVERVYSEARRENLACMGRRWWKTSSFAKRAVKQMVSKQGYRIVWGAPVYPQVWTAWYEIERMAQGQFKTYRGKDDLHMECPWTESTIRFRSLDNPDNARSLTADEVIIDEAADVHPDAWYKVLQPMLLSTHGTSWKLGTPKGHNWFWREFQSVQERLEHDPSADCAAWQVPTLGARIVDGALVRDANPYENPTIDWAELVRIFNNPSMSPLAFQQEYLAQFIDDGAGVFVGVEGASFGVQLVPPYFGPFVNPYPGQFSMGVDWGRNNDFTVVTVMDVVTKRVVDWWRVNQRSWDSIVSGVAAIYNRWARVGTRSNQVSVLVEHNSIGSPNFEQLSKLIPCTPWTATNASKAALIERLQFDIEHRLTTYPKIGPLMNELTIFEATRLPSGLIRYAAPEGEHDDCVISLALANEGTMYRDIGTEDGQFEVQLDSSADAAELENPLTEYRASLWAARAAELGADRIPYGAQELIRRLQEKA